MFVILSVSVSAIYLENGTSYSTTGTWRTDGAYAGYNSLIDGNWNSKSASLSTSILFINYSVSGENFIWVVKDMASKDNGIKYNLTVPSDCESMHPLQLFVKSIAIPSHDTVEWYCVNSTGNHLLRKHGPVGVVPLVFEEGLYYDPVVSTNIDTSFSTSFLTLGILSVLLCGFIFRKNPKVAFMIITLGGAAMGLWFLIEVVL